MSSVLTTDRSKQIATCGGASQTVTRMFPVSAFVYIVNDVAADVQSNAEKVRRLVICYLTC